MYACVRVCVYDKKNSKLFQKGLISIIRKFHISCRLAKCFHHGKKDRNIRNPPLAYKNYKCRTQDYLHKLDKKSNLWLPLRKSPFSQCAISERNLPITAVNATIINGFKGISYQILMKKRGF